MPYIKNCVECDVGIPSTRKFCSDCLEIRQKKQQKRNVEKNRFKIIERKYGLSKQAYLNMVEAQNNLCGICGKEERHNRSLAVDHNHDTGEVRELLCTDCNWLVGMLERFPEDIIDKSRLYIKKHT